MRKVFATLMLAGLMVVAGMPSSAEAGILDRLFGRGTTRAVTTSRVDSGRRYSYEPGSSATSRSSSSSKPSYLLQKSDSNKYRVN